MEGVFISLHVGTVVPSSVSQAGVYNVSAWVGSRLLCVDGASPSEAEGVLLSLLDGKALHGQRLHHIVGIVHGSRVFQDGLVHGAGHGELEVGVVSHLHVGKVLMREQFQNHARNGRQAGFAVVAVPHASAGPLGAVAG